MEGAAPIPSLGNPGLGFNRERLDLAGITWHGGRNQEKGDPGKGGSRKKGRSRKKGDPGKRGSRKRGIQDTLPWSPWNVLGVVGCSGELWEFPWSGRHPLATGISGRGQIPGCGCSVPSPVRVPRAHPGAQQLLGDIPRIPESMRLEKPSRARHRERPFPVILSAGVFWEEEG